MTCHGRPDGANQRDESAESRDESALEAARRADADQVPHEKPQIEAAGMNQQPLADVRVSAEVHAAHPTGFKEMSEGPFQAVAAQPQQSLAARTANAPAIPIHGVARGRMLLPVPPAAIGFGDVAANAHGFEIDERLIAVVALVGDKPP